MGKHSKHNDLEVKYKKIIFLIIIIILFTIITIYNAQRENRQKSGQSNLNYQNINEEMLNDIIEPVNNNKYQSILQCRYRYRVGLVFLQGVNQNTHRYRR